MGGIVRWLRQGRRWGWQEREGFQNKVLCAKTWRWGEGGGLWLSKGWVDGGGGSRVEIVYVTYFFFRVVMKYLKREGRFVWLWVCGYSPCGPEGLAAGPRGSWPHHVQLSSRKTNSPQGSATHRVVFLSVTPLWKLLPSHARGESPRWLQVQSRWQWRVTITAPNLNAFTFF